VRKLIEWVFVYSLDGLLADDRLDLVSSAELSNGIVGRRYCR
jgi:hypothetical protein